MTAPAVIEPPSPNGTLGWVPKGTDKGTKPARRRRELIRDMAPRGYTSPQIAQLLQIDGSTVRRIARKEQIRIVGDDALGVRTRKGIDSNHIIRETIEDLANVQMGLDLVNFDELDPAEVADWIASLGKSIQVLNRLHKRLREATQ